MGNNEKLLSELQEKAEVNLTEEVYKKHASARKLHQLYEQLVTRWNELKNNLSEMLESIQLKVQTCSYMYICVNNKHLKMCWRMLENTVDEIENKSFL